MMQANSRNISRATAMVAFALIKIFAGLFLLWGQFEFQEPGTVYGFLWPRNIHEFFTDLRTVNLLILAAWLIRSGIVTDHRNWRI